MSMIRYNPFDSTLPLTMRDAMDRLLEQSFAPTWRSDLYAIGRGFPVDVYEDELNYVIEASMPGVKPEDLKVTATANAVSIRATTTGLQKQEKSAEPKGKKTGDYVRRERYSGEVTRVIDLPDAINPAKIKASYKRGVLTLEVPKVEEVTPRKIDIVVEE